ncbi:helix-turn-helix domain-containing protein [Actinocorallia sp. API 0066]|uniref:helix-turn-helix transcriptional regulator n=1 Tax=Actinocorallia sp. API 0066 TaxID=2896846 RepID=UPI001E3E58EC|nr:helix-turn-helix domain-containing protein [Actinocorallia sp. API 0066]MCD0448330.1 helix-turn-helix domain-containing protein [Actinocorallia sp. API 0066]
MANPTKTTRRRKTTASDTERLDQLSLNEVCEVLSISPSTFYDWRAKNLAPACFKLPNGQLRFYRAEFLRWLDGLEG